MVGNFLKAQFLKYKLGAVLVVLSFPLLIFYNSCTSSKFNPDFQSTSKLIFPDCLTAIEEKASLFEAFPLESDELGPSLLNSAQEIITFDKKLFLATYQGLFMSGVRPISWQPVSATFDLPGEIIRSIDVTANTMTVSTYKGIRQYNFSDCKVQDQKRFEKKDIHLFHRNSQSGLELAATVDGELHIKHEKTNSDFINKYFANPPVNGEGEEGESSSAKSMDPRLQKSPITAFESSAEVILVGTSFGLFRSINDGLDFLPISDELGTANTQVLDLAAVQGRFFVATAQGLFKSTDGGTNWDSVVLLNRESADVGTIRVNDLDVDGKRIYAATDAGVFWLNLSELSVEEVERADDFLKWKLLYQNVENEIYSKVSVEAPVILLTAVLPKTELSEFDQNVLYSSLNHGQTWVPYLSELRVSPVNEVEEMELASKGSYLVSYSKNSSVPIYLSKDFGVTWSQINIADGGGAPCLGEYFVNDVNFVSRTSIDDEILISTSCGLFSSSMASLNWTRFGPITIKKAFRIMVKDTVLIVRVKKKTVPLDVPPSVNGFMVSFDKGATWQYNFKNLEVSCPMLRSLQGEAGFSPGFAFDVDGYMALDCTSGTGSPKLAIASLSKLDVDGMEVIKDLSWDYKLLNPFFTKPSARSADPAIIKQVTISGKELLVTIEAGSTYMEIIYSDDLGESWTTIDLPKELSDSEGAIFSHLALNGQIFVSSANFGVAVTRDFGVSWTRFGQPDGLTDLNVKNIFADDSYLYSRVFEADLLNKYYRSSLEDLDLQ